MKRNPKWTTDELTLALDLFHSLPSGQINARNEKIISLSQDLNRLRSAEIINAETYRNANGTALKLHNFSRFDSTRTARGIKNGGKLEEVVWRRFDGKRDLLNTEAREIRARISSLA